ncbi:MAG: XRE family transcriptional regulator [Tannerella sp.]|jgi:hypothetical protein|nr:XRE family transcriptional regulator [Tannerella sp.]
MDKIEIDIGKMIRKELYRQKRSIAWLAEQVGRHRCHLPRMLKKTSLDSDLLCQISIVLGVDYHSIYSQKIKRCKNATQ